MSSLPSCLECKRRHIRCDRRQPCGYCSRLSIPCTFPTREEVTYTERGSSRQSQAPIASSSSEARIQALEETVRRLEERLAVFESNVESTRDSASVPQSSASSQADYSSHLGVTDQALASTTSLQRPPQSTFTNVSHLADPNLSRSLWLEYKTNIDPLLKLVDHQFVEDTLLTFPHPSNQGKAMLLAIFFANEACKPQVSIPMYKDLERALKQTLQQSNVYTHPTVPTLQALTLYLTCGRTNMDQEYLCATLPVVVQLAVRLHLNQDPAELGYMPSESEYRRRLWWHIVALDVRTAEASCSRPIIQMQHTNTMIPSMVRDTVLQVTTFFSSSEHAPCTFYAVVALEMANVAKRVLFPSTTDTDPAARLVLCNKLHEDLFAKYANQCDCVDSPVCRLTIEWCKIYWQRQKILLFHWDQVFLQNVSHEDAVDPDVVLQTCVDLIRRVHNLKTDPDYSQWAWLWQNCVEWDAVAVALCMVTQKAGVELVREAWAVIDVVFEMWTGEFEDPAHRKRWKSLTTFRDWVKAMQLGSLPGIAESGLTL